MELWVSFWFTDIRYYNNCEFYDNSLEKTGKIYNETDNSMRFSLTSFIIQIVIALEIGYKCSDRCHSVSKSTNLVR